MSSAPGREPALGGAAAWGVAAAVWIALLAYAVVHLRVFDPTGIRVAAELLAGGSAHLVASLALLALPGTAGLALLAAAAWPWTAALVGRDRWWRALAAAVAASWTLVALQVALGAAGLLTPTAVAAATAGLVLAAGLLGRRLAAAPTPAAPPATDSAGGALRRPLTLAFGLLAALAWGALLAITAAVPPWGWDTLVYHLADVFHFSATGRLDPLPLGIPQAYFPKVGELHSSWFFLLAGAGDEAWRTAGLAQAPLAATLALAVGAAGRELGLGAARAWLAPAAALVPLAFVQVTSAYVDLAFAAFFLATLAFALRAARRGRVGDLVVLAAAAGLALGTKLSFLYLGPAALLPLLALRRRRRALGPRPLVAAVALAVVALVACGAWLIPPLLRHGNPLYPVELELAGVEWLDGPVAVTTTDGQRGRFVDGLAGWLAYPFRETSHGRLGYSVDSGFGPLFAAGLVAWPVALLLVVRRLRDGDGRGRYGGRLQRGPEALRRRRLLALAALPALLAAWLVLSPFEHPRYVLPAHALALLALGMATEATARRPGPAAGRRAGPPAAIALAVLAGAAFSAVGGLATAVPESAAVAREVGGDRWRPQRLYELVYGSVGRAFNRLDAEPATTVTADSALFVAPLFGWHGRHRLVHAATPGSPTFADRPPTPTYDDWRRVLEEQGVRRVVTWVPWWDPQAPPTAVRRWIADHPAEFELLADHEGRAAVWRPVRTVAAGAPAARSPAPLPEPTRGESR